MKKILLLTILAFTAMVSMSAQDLITQKDGTDIKAKILEVNEMELKYKLWSNLEGPTYSIDKSQILLVRYQNGTNEVFSQQNISSMESLPATRSQISSSFHRGYFAKDISSVHPGMKYKALKSFYDTEDFSYLGNPVYSPSRAWLNLALPGLAQITMGESGLGAMYLGLGTAGTLMWTIPFGDYLHDGHFTQVGISWFIAGVVFCATTEVVSILNAIKVAKVKSLHLADMEKLEAGYSFTVTPTLLPSYTPSGLKPIPGVGLQLVF